MSHPPPVPAASETAHPKPRHSTRKGVLKSVIKIVGGLILLLVLLAVAANLIFGRDIPAPDVSDLLPEQMSIPDGENAYTHLIAITNVWHMPEGAQEMLSDYRKAKEVEETVLKELIEKNENTFAAIRRGLAFETCCHPSRATLEYDPAPSVWMRVSDLLIAKTRLQRTSGSVSNAVETLGDQLAFADRVGEYPNNLVYALVGRALILGGLRQARDIARDEKITPANLEHMAEILAGLKPLAPSIVRAWKGEHRFASETLAQLHSGTLAEGDLLLADTVAGMDINTALKWMPRIFFKPNETQKLFADAARCVISDATRTYSEMRSPALEKSMKEDFERRRKHLVLTNAIGIILARVMLPVYSSAMENECMVESDISATGLVVACRRYRFREGRLPAKLDDLVPSFLPALPRDPYDGKTFRYDPVREIVWSVGKDLHDSGGSTKQGGDSGKGRRGTEDAVYRLSGEED